MKISWHEKDKGFICDTQGNAPSVDSIIYLNDYRPGATSNGNFRTKYNVFQIDYVISIHSMSFDKMREEMISRKFPYGVIGLNDYEIVEKFINSFFGYLYNFNLNKREVEYGTQEAQVTVVKS